MIVPVNTILFDMDNTLFDLVEAQIAACTAVVGALGRADGNHLFEQYFRSGRHGFESHENILDYLGDHNIPEEGNYHRLRRIYETVKLDTVAAYEGVDSTLWELRKHGYHMGVITDAHSRDATRRLEKTGLLPHFEGMVTFDMVMIKKPAPEPFLCALDMMKATSGSAIVVGDSPRRDIKPARDLGIRTVYARYGDRFSQERKCPEADFCINKMPELLSVIRGLAE